MCAWPQREPDQSGGGACSGHNREDPNLATDFLVCDGFYMVLMQL